MRDIKQSNCVVMGSVKKKAEKENDSSFDSDMSSGWKDWNIIPLSRTLHASLLNVIGDLSKIQTRIFVKNNKVNKL